MFNRILLILIVAVSLTMGCGADYGRVKVDDKSIEVEAGTNDENREDKPKHCPPGHRKKGWC